MEQIINKNINEVSFLSDNGNFATSLDLKLDIIIYNLLKISFG